MRFKDYLTNCSEETVSDADLKSALQSLLSLVTSTSRGIDVQEDGIQPRQYNQPGFSVGVRYFGVWEMPEGEEDDGDYDWEVLSQKSRNDLARLIDKVSTQYPKMKFSYSTEEKNWIELNVERK